MHRRLLCSFRGAVVLLAAMAFFLPSGTCLAGGPIAIAPTRLELSDTSRSTVFSIQNLGDGPVDFDVDVSEWTQSTDGESQLNPTNKLRISPESLSVIPGGQGQIRVALAGAPGRVEQAYRVIVTERPLAPLPDQQGGGVGIILRQSIPVFVRPKLGAAEPDLSFSPPTLTDGTVEITLSNVGRRFSFIKKVELTALAGETELFTRSIDGWYLLSGVSRVYRFELPDELCPAITDLVFRATAETLSATSEFPRPRGDCRSEARRVDPPPIPSPLPPPLTPVAALPPVERERLPRSTHPDAVQATAVRTFAVTATIASPPPAPMEISPNGGSPMLVSRVSDTQITITQFQGAGSCANQSSLYYGPLTAADLASYHWTGSVCGLGTVAPLNVGVASGSIFFVLVGADSTHGVEGSYGKNSTGSEIPPRSPGACAVQVLGATCP